MTQLIERNKSMELKTKTGRLNSNGKEFFNSLSSITRSRFFARAWFPATESTSFDIRGSWLCRHPTSRTRTPRTPTIAAISRTTVCITSPRFSEFIRAATSTAFYWGFSTASCLGSSAARPRTARPNSPAANSTVTGWAAAPTTRENHPLMGRNEETPESDDCENFGNFHLDEALLDLPSRQEVAYASSRRRALSESNFYMDLKTKKIANL